MIANLMIVNLKRLKAIFPGSTGLQPYVARDLMQFPACIPGEGLMDVVVQSLVGLDRIETLV